MMRCNTKYRTCCGRWSQCGLYSLLFHQGSNMCYLLSLWAVQSTTQSRSFGSFGWSFSCSKLGTINEHTCCTKKHKLKDLRIKMIKKTEFNHQPLKSDTKNCYSRMKMQKRILTLNDRSNKLRRIRIKLHSEFCWLTKRPSRNTKDISRIYPT